MRGMASCRMYEAGETKVHTPPQDQACRVPAPRSLPSSGWRCAGPPTPASKGCEWMLGNAEIIDKETSHCWPVHGPTHYLKVQCPSPGY